MTATAMSVRITAPLAPACLDVAIRLLITGIRPILVTGIAHTRYGVGGGETEQHAIFRHACTVGLEGITAKLGRRRTHRATWFAGPPLCVLMPLFC